MTIRGGGGGGDAIERQLIDIFVDGSATDQLKMKILRDQPATLQGAVAVATNEQNLRAHVQMSHHSGYTSAQTHTMCNTHLWRLTTLEVKGLITDIESTRSIAAHRPWLGVGVVTK